MAKVPPDKQAILDAIRKVVHDGRKPSRAHRAAVLARRGLITLPQGTPDLCTRPVAIRGEPISRALIRDRR